MGHSVVVSCPSSEPPSIWEERDWLVLEILLVAVKQKLRHLDIQSGAR